MDWVTAPKGTACRLVIVEPGGRFVGVEKHWLLDEGP